jgi:hypothetical protein
MLRCLAADTHCIGVVIEPILNFVQNGLVLPSRDAALDPTYKLGTDPSSWQPYPASALPRGLKWGSIKLFLMTKPDQFTLPGPLSVRSPEYAKEIEEVRVLGGRDSSERTNRQTAIAIFWKRWRRPGSQRNREEGSVGKGH